MAAKSIQELAAVLPGGTYISFTVLAQLTTNSTDMSARLSTEPCNCGNHDAGVCTSRYVCGAGFYELTIALVVITAVIVLMLAWYGEDLQQEKTSVKDEHRDRLEKRASQARSVGAATAKTVAAPVTDSTPFACRTVNNKDLHKQDEHRLNLHTTAGSVAAPPANSSSSQVVCDHKQPLVSMSDASLRRRYYELVVHLFIRAIGGTCVFLVLALFTPPVSTCLLPPCQVPAVVQSCVPLLVSFAVSAFVVVKNKFVRRAVKLVDSLFNGAGGGVVNLKSLVGEQSVV